MRPDAVFFTPAWFHILASIIFATAWFSACFSETAMAQQPAPSATQPSVSLPSTGHPSATQPFVSLPSAGQPSDDAHIVRWISLNAGLNQTVMRFDEQARDMERHLSAFERTQLKSHLDAARASADGQNPSSPRTPEEWRAFNAVAREPSMCTQLARALNAYIQAHTNDLSDVITRLAALPADPDSRTAQARAISDALDTVPNQRRTQEILYLCLYKQKNELGQPRPESVEKAMRNWFRIQLPLLDAWLGNVD